MTITAKIILDSISPRGIRLLTLQLRYPRFIHSEFMTHRVFSRNASSSRAIRIERMIQDVLDDPAMPIHWGKNQAGMQAREEHDGLVDIKYVDWVGDRDDVFFKPGLTREQAWLEARNRAVDIAWSLHKAGYHKQIVNRILEPFAHINVLVSSTDWNNFFGLRYHPDAQPEIRELAKAIYAAIQASTPNQLAEGEWHLPYILPEEKSSDLELQLKKSVARCARVSYLTHNNEIPTTADDIGLYDRLVVSEPLHASPAEHQATPDEHIIGDSYDRESYQNPWDHGNFVGWIQYRKTLPREYISRFTAPQEKEECQ